MAGDAQVTMSADQPDLRVIVVGRTGLESSLRRDAGIELVRARTTLQAIGELSDPADGPVGRDSVVLIAPDAHAGQDARRFITAVRLVDPSARVLLVAGAHMRASLQSEAAVYDGVIDPDSSAPLIREVLKAARTRPVSLWTATEQTAATPPTASGVLQTENATPFLQPNRAVPKTSQASQTNQVRAALGAAAEEAAAVQAAAAADAEMAIGPDADLGASNIAPAAPATFHSFAGSTTAKPSDVDLSLDTALVQAALVGREVLTPAMQVLRARLALAGTPAVMAEQVVFVPQEAGEPAAGVRAEVRHRDRLFGWLTGPPGMPMVVLPVLQNQGDWLACWMALAYQQAELRRAALVDDLTGAWNRRYFERFLAAAIERAQIHRHSLSILLFDVDNFKFFNDKYGHGAGDDILRETVRLLKSVIRSGDRVCRIGGDEFAVVFYEPSGPRESGSRPLEGASHIAARFQKQIAEARFPKLGPMAPGRLTVSGGLATYPWDGRTVEELVAHADHLAIDAKRKGKDKITFGPDAVAGGEKGTAGGNGGGEKNGGVEGPGAG